MAGMTSLLGTLVVYVETDFIAADKVDLGCFLCFYLTVCWLDCSL